MKKVYSTLLLASIFLLSFAQDPEWEDRTSMPEGKHHPVTFAVDGFGYAVTGSAQFNNYTSDNYRYDPVTDSWEEMNNFPGVSRSFAIGQAYGGKGYVGFGASATSYLRDIWEYDPAEDDWDLLTVCPCVGRRHPALLMHDDKLFVGLGDGAGGNYRDWWMYDMTADEWEQQDDLPGASRHHPFMFVANDELYAGMGHGGNIIYDDWYHFDETTGSWETMDDFPGEARVAGTQFFHDDAGYVLSGDGSNHSWMPTGEFWKYDGSSDTWEELTPHPGISLWAPGSFVLEDTIFFLGGQNRQSSVIQEDVYSFQLVDDPIDTIPPAGLNQLDAQTMKVYPNPSSGYVYLDGGNDVQLFRLFDVQGRTILEGSQLNGVLDLTGTDKGIYQLRLQMVDGSIKTARLIKQ